MTPRDETLQIDDDAHGFRPSSMRVVDLFCGSGGLSKGLIDAGMNVVSAYDNWKICVETYRRNIADHVHVLDLGDVSAAADAILPHEADMIVGGPPCQDFSTAGKRIESSHASLTVAFAETVEKCRPRFVLMENVPTARNSGAYRTMKDILSDYAFQEIVLDASLCGVPQKRRRFFSFGSLDGGEAFLDRVAQKLAQEPLSVKEYLKDEIDVEFYYRHPRNYSRRSVFSVHEPSPTVRGVNRPVPPHYEGNRLDSAPPRTTRPLTTRERSRIQTFPVDWDWNAADRNADAEQQIGNAVPPNLARFVGKSILHALH